MSDVFKSADYAREALAREEAERSPPSIVSIADITPEMLEECRKPGSVAWITFDELAPRPSITPIPVASKTVRAGLPRRTRHFLDRMSPMAESDETEKTVLHHSV